MSALQHVIKTLRKDPFRAFFPLGAVLAIAGVFPWTLQFFGIAGYPVEFHRSIMINGFMLSFVCGFLMTAIPRFTSSDFASTGEVASIFVMICLASFLAATGFYGYSHLVASAAVLLLMLFGIRRFLKRKANPPHTFVFVACGLVLWLASNFFLFLSSEGVSLATEHMFLWRDLFSNGAIMSMVLGVGGRLIPGIFGWQEIVVSQRERYEGSGSFLKAFPLTMWILVSIYLLSFVLLTSEPHWISFVLRFLVVWYFGLIYWKLHRAPKERTCLSWCIWLSCWCLLVGALLPLLWRELYVHMLHATLIGGFSLLSILISTRVTLAHSDEGQASEKSLKMIYVFTVLMFFAAITRIVAILWPRTYLLYLGYAAIIWMCGFCVWGWIMLPRMLKKFRKANVRVGPL